MWSKDGCEEKFELFWSNLMNKKTELDVADPRRPRSKRKLPDFYHSQSSNGSFYHDYSKHFYLHL